jgi:hypothetical protein
LLAGTGEWRTWHTTGDKVDSAKWSGIKFPKVSFGDLPGWTVRPKCGAGVWIDLNSSRVRDTRVFKS